MSKEKRVERSKRGRQANGQVLLQGRGRWRIKTQETRGTSTSSCCCCCNLHFAAPRMDLGAQDGRKWDGKGLEEDDAGWGMGHAMGHG